MRLRGKVVKNGNSWSVRLPKPLLEEAGIQPKASITLRAQPGRITIYSESTTRSMADKDRYEVAKEDVQAVWNEAFEQVWLELFGIDE